MWRQTAREGAETDKIEQDIKREKESQAERDRQTDRRTETLIRNRDKGAERYRDRQTKHRYIEKRKERPIHRDR